MTERLGRQIRFLLEADKMKLVERRNLIADGSRRENDAEHSWHLALVAMLLFEHAGEGVDLLRVLRMALIHDLIEIYAGDTFAYDVQGNREKMSREREAADRLFGLLPPGQGAELRELWEEFDAMQTPDSRYAAAIDRLQPLLLNSVTGGHTWVEGKVCESQVRARADLIREAVPALWPLAEQIVAEAVEKGEIRPDNTEFAADRNTIG